MSYFCYLCLFTCSGGQHILWCVFGVFFFFLCNICSQFLWIVLFSHRKWGPSWSCSHDVWIYDYLCNQCLSPLKFVGDLWQLGGCLWVLRS